MAFNGTVEDSELETISEAAAAADPAAPTFEQSILDNLAKAGIQNGRRRERIELASVDAYAGSYIQAVGERRDNPDHARIGIAIGPQYGTVSAGFIKEAARESIKAGDIDLLCVMAFAFDPQATGVTEVFRACPVVHVSDPVVDTCRLFVTLSRPKVCLHCPLPRLLCEFLSGLRHNYNDVI